MEFTIAVGMAVSGFMVFCGLVSLGLSLYNGMNKIAEAISLERHWVLSLSEVKNESVKSVSSAVTGQ